MTGARSRAVAALALGYVGIYLCRKNLAVAVPLLGHAFGASRGEIGRIASVGTAAYAIGKLTLAPLVDRVGGRAGFLAALVFVALFGAAGAAAPSLALLTLAYAANRFAGAAGWPAMMKLVPTWFAARQATAVAVLSLSYVAGGVAATLLARAVVEHGGSWRAVMGVPSLPLIAIAVVCAFTVRAGPLAIRPGADQPRAAAWSAARVLVTRPRFLIVCALSFVLTLVRESFNTWSVDFLATVARPGAGASASGPARTARAQTRAIPARGSEGTPITARHEPPCSMTARASSVAAIPPTTYDRLSAATAVARRAANQVGISFIIAGQPAAPAKRLAP